MNVWGDASNRVVVVGFGSAYNTATGGYEREFKGLCQSKAAHDTYIRVNRCDSLSHVTIAYFSQVLQLPLVGDSMQCGHDHGEQ